MNQLTKAVEISYVIPSYIDVTLQSYRTLPSHFILFLHVIGEIIRLLIYCNILAVVSLSTNPPELHEILVLHGRGIILLLQSKFLLNVFFVYNKILSCQNIFDVKCDDFLREIGITIRQWGRRKLFF